MKKLLLLFVLTLSFTALNAQTTLAHFGLNENPANPTADNVYPGIMASATFDGLSYTTSYCLPSEGLSTNQNNNFLLIEINTTGFTNINISWKQQQSSNTNNVRWNIDANNGVSTISNTITPEAGNSNTNCITPASIGFNSTFDNNPGVSFKFISNKGSGNRTIFLDDITITGTPIPTGAPTLAPSLLPSFGDVCINPSAAPVKSFLLGGTNLTTASINIGTLSSLTGYTYSLSSSGPWSNPLTFTPSGSTDNRPIYVRFNPTSTTSNYNESIIVSGGGATTVNVLASGNGVTTPSSTITNASPNNVSDVCYAGGGVQTLISWDAVPSATKYDVYFGTSATPTTLIASEIADTYTSIGSLTANTPYYWKVVPKNDCGGASELEVGVWSFTTANAPCAADYCDPSTTILQVRSITQVIYADIDNSSSSSTGSASYEDYTHIVGTVVQGASNTFTVEGFTNGANAFYYNVFIDWDHSGTFDVGEGYFAGTISNSTGEDVPPTSTSTNIIVPNNTLLGNTRMRVISSLQPIASNPCPGNITEGQIEDYTINVLGCTDQVGDPNDFGDGVWNVYGYNVDNIDLAGVDYRGYYEEPSLAFDSSTQWSTNGSPSDAASWLGCTVGNNNFTTRYKRKNFPCGTYQINVDNHEDGARLYIDGTQIWEDLGSGDSHNNVWTGQLDSTSEVELRVISGGGQASAAMSFVFSPDSTNPTVTAANNVTANTSDDGTGDCTVEVAVTDATFDDNCESNLTWVMTGATVGSGSGQVGTYTFNIGETTITYTNTDGVSNTATSSMIVTVSDNEAPTITAAADQTQTADAGVCEAAVTVVGPSTGDNCGVASVINDYNGTSDASDVYPVGTTIVTWTVTDIHGNTSQATQEIEVTDDEAPTITAAADQTQTADAGVCEAAVTVVGPSTGDNCGVASVINDYNGTSDASDVYPVGTTIVTWTVTDIHGNTSQATQEIEVTDDEAPTITAAADQTQTADADVCEAAVTVVGPSRGDNCGVASVINDYNGTSDASDVYPVGTTTITWTVTDIHGNSSQATQEIEVTDDEAPTITAAADQTQTADAGVCEAAVTVVGPSTGDNCGVASVINDYNGTSDASDVYPVGTTIVTWTVTDIHGNTSQATQEIEVTDDEAPTITAAADQTQTADAGVCEAAVTVVGPSTGDNCGVASVINDYNGTSDASDVYPVGTTIVTWTVTDIHGNSSQATQEIEVTDDEDPSITAAADQTQTADAGVCEAAVTVVGPSTGDNCGVASVINDYNGTSDASDVYPVGTTIVTWTVTDIHGNSSQATQEIEVTDDEDPSITAAADQTQTADADVCEAAVTVVGPSTGDNCGVASVINDYNGTSDASDVYPVGTTTITWTVTDIHGNSSQATQEIEVTDDEDPSITAAADQTQTADAGVCEAAVTVVGPSRGDNCGVASVINDYNGTSDASDVYPVGTTTITWTVTDIHGNSSQATQEIEVTDDEDPSITAAADQTQTADAGVCEAAVTVVGPSRGDNCGVASVINDYNGTSDASDIYPVGTTTITWTVTDIHGNTSQATQEIEVTDDEDPSITAAADQTQTADAGVCEAAVTVVGPSRGDNCGVASVINDYNGTSDASDIYPVGTTTITWTVTDIHGNTSQATQEIEVTDDEDPSITAAADQTQTADAGVCEAAVTVVGPSRGDNCGVASVINDYNGTSDASDIYPVGTTTITWTVTDIHGNTSQATQEIEVTDDEDPSITAAADQTQTADAGVCEAAVTVVGPSRGDNCGVASVINDYNGTSDASDVYPVGTTTITWTVTDIHGNTSQATQEIEVTDDEAPSITAAADQTQTADAGVCEAAVTVVGPSRGDNCGVASVINDYNGTSDASDVYPVGTTIVTWTVTDIHGNSSQATQEIEVTDDEAPTITAAADQTQTADAGVCEAAVTVVGPSTGDNCGVASVINDYNGTSDASDVYPVGTTTITWTVTDIHGNSSQATQEIEVTDDEAPTITAAADQTQTADADVCEAAVTVVGPSTGDNCGVASVINDYNGTSDASDVYPVGTTTITWTVTDIHGNSSQATQEIEVTDDEDPSITAAADQTQTADAGVCEAAVTVVGPSRGDNCGVASVINDYNGTSDASDIYPVGTTTITWTVTDIHGNSSQATQEIEVTDDEDPSITAAADQTQTADAGVCEAAVTVVGPSRGDNCGVASVINDYNGTSDASDIYPVGTTTITWTVTDIHGNTSQATQEIEVTDDEDPSITAAADQTQTADAGVCEAAVTVVGPSRGDNCGVASVINDYNGTSDASDIYPVGTTTITWTVTDIHGNTSQATQEIEVTDDEDPSITAAADQTQTADAGVCEAAVTVVGPSRGDNCGVASVINDYNGTSDASDIYPVGTTTITWTVTDIHGNTSQATQEIEVTDDEDPSITAAADQTQTADAGVCEAAVTVVGPSRGDNCGVASVINDYNGTSDASDVYPVGTTTITWTVTDIHGNTSQATQEIEVTDDEAPSITAAADQTQTADAGVCEAAVTVVGPSRGDNCGVASVINDYNGTSDASGIYPVGTTTITWTVTDIHGNTSQATQEIEVTDDEAPSITAAADQTQTADAGVCEAAVTVVGPSRGDNCGVASVINDYNGTSDASDVYPVGTTTITWTVTDIHGNSSQATQYITVTDDEDPSITVVDQTQDNDPGACQAYVVVEAPVTGDNCAVASVVNDFNGTSDASDTYLVGTTTVTWTVTDIHGNSTVETQDITVEDNEAPVVNCNTIMVQLDPNGNVSIVDSDLDNASTDNCGIASYSLSQYDFDCSDIGGDLDELIISEYIDGPDNKKWIELFNGTGNPILLGEITNTGPVYYYYIQIGGGTPIGILGEIDPYDEDLDQSGTFKVSHSSAAAETGINTNYGTPNIYFDGSQSIGLINGTTVVDNIPAQGWINDVTLIRNIDVLEGKGSGVQSEWTSSSVSYTNLGKHDINIETDLGNNVLLTVTDIHGNSATCEATVFVKDITPPTAIAQDVEVYLDVDGNGSTTAALVDNGSSDTCSNVTLTLNKYDFTCADIATNNNPVTLTVTDKYGNYSEAFSTVKVFDTISPKALCKPVTVQLDANGYGSITAAQVDNGSNDACGIASLELDVNSFDCSNVGANTVTLIVTDNNNNTSTCTATVTVEDNVAPVVVCNNLTVTVVGGVYTLSQAEINGLGAGSYDNCDTDLTFEVEDEDSISFDCDDIGIPQNIILKVTDNYGNASYCDNITITVEGVIPTVNITEGELPPFCQGAVVVLTANTNVDATYLWSTGETTKSIEVNADGNYGVTVTSGSGCTASANYALSGFDATEHISSYTILAHDEIFLHGSNLVQSGGIGVEANNGLIKLHQATTVVGFAKAANFDLKQGSTIGAGLQFNAPAAPNTIPAFVANTYSNVASPDVIANSDQNLDLAVYDVVQIGQGVTVTFTKPNVYINQLVTQQNASIEFDGCSNLFINQKFTLAQYGTINKNGENVVIYVNNDIQIEKGSYVRARMHSNGNEFLVKGETVNKNKEPAPTIMKGLFIGRRVHGSINVKWEQDDICDTGCPVLPPANQTQAKKSTAKNDGLMLQVKAWPNPSDTAFNIALSPDSTFSTNDVQIQVFDTSGKLLHSNKFKYNETYKFGEKFEGGTYLVKLTQAGKLLFTRVVKY